MTLDKNNPLDLVIWQLVKLILYQKFFVLNKVIWFVDFVKESNDIANKYNLSIQNLKDMFLEIKEEIMRCAKK